MGITIQSIQGENSIFKKAEQSVIKYRREKYREEIKIAIMDIQKDHIQIGDNLDRKILITELQSKLDKFKQINQNGIIEYKNNKYKITDTFEVIDLLEDDNSDVTDEKNVVLFDGNGYIKTNLEEKEFIKTEKEFTIATRIKISRETQMQVPYMSILGNHHGMEGFMMQFDQKTTNLVIGNLSGIVFDYTPYYNNWTDIVVTYNNEILSLYVNKKLLESKNVTITPYENFLIGTDYTEEDRVMRGMMASVKIWNKELLQQDIQNLDMLKSKTNINKENTVLETRLNSKEDIYNIGEIEDDLIFKDIDYKVTYELSFKGSTYINTNIKQSDFIGNDKEYTIALRTKINREEQQKVNYMDIIGNHSDVSGLIFQFDRTTTNLCIGRWGAYYVVDYTKYYDKWTDIVITYKDNKFKIYINKEYIGEKETSIEPYSNLLIGTAYSLDDRAIIGQISSIKIWKKQLENEDIQNMDMEQEKTNIQKENIYQEINLNSLENINKIGTFAGDNYTFILKYE